MDPTWQHVNGWAKLSQGPGTMRNLDRLAGTTPSARIALTPVLAVMSLDQMGVLKLGLPDLRRWPLQNIKGDYAFKNGRMTIERFTINSDPLTIGTTGAVNLGNGNLLLNVRLHSPKKEGAGALDANLRVSGTMSHPKVDLQNLKKKAVQAAIGKLLGDSGANKEIDKTLKGIFH